MNIFVLDERPFVSAQMMCDRHVVKMIVESAQLLCSVYWMNGIEAPYKLTHKNHPCAIWVSESRINFAWLYAHLAGLLMEYKSRYGKDHKTEEVYNWILNNPSDFLENKGLTKFVQCMPEQYRIEGDAVTAYRNYYIGEKSSFATWKNGNVPEWFVKGINK